MGLLVSGRNPAAAKTAERSYFTATAGQTVFTLVGGYQAGDVDVFLNGIRLVENDDFSATDGSTIILATAANLGDHLAVVCYYQFQATGHWTKTESDGRYLTASGVNPMTAYLKTPNYGITSASDSSSASLEASPLLGEQGVGVKAFGRSVATTGGDILYTSDSRGAGGRHRFGYWNGTSFTNTMTLDSSGRLTVPNQPSFRSESSTYNSTTGVYSAWTTSNSSISIATVYRNIGGHFNTTTGIFTSPVTGKYLVTAMYSNGTGTVERNIGWLYYNGTNIGEWVESYGTYDNSHGSIVLWLNAGDTIQFATHPGIPYNSITAGIDLIN